MSTLFVTGVGASELKVGYVNTQRIFRDAPAAQKAAKPAVENPVKHVHFSNFIIQ